MIFPTRVHHDEILINKGRKENNQLFIIKVILTVLAVAVRLISLSTTYYSKYIPSCLTRLYKNSYNNISSPYISFNSLLLT